MFRTYQCAINNSVSRDSHVIKYDSMAQHTTFSLQHLTTTTTTFSFYENIVYNSGFQPFLLEWNPKAMFRWLEETLFISYVISQNLVTDGYVHRL